MARFDLSDAEWDLIRALLPNKPRGVARVSDRRMLNGIFYVLRTGSPWREPPRWAAHRCGVSGPAIALASPVVSDRPSYAASADGRGAPKLQ